MHNTFLLYIAYIVCILPLHTTAIITRAYLLQNNIKGILLCQKNALQI